MIKEHAVRRFVIAGLCIAAGAFVLAYAQTNRNQFQESDASGGLTLSLNSIALTVGRSATVAVSGASGTVSVENSAPAVASASYGAGLVTIVALKAGSAAVTVKDRQQGKVINVSVLSDSAGGTPPPAASASYALLAWNDLGMHCVDGKDYSVFSILPPYNNLHAQLVNKSTGKLVTGNVTLTYESYADNTVPPADPHYGSINTISSTKTNFWTWVKSLFGAQPAPDHGLNLSDPALSNPTPSRQPAAMKLDASGSHFIAEGLPITPFDDKGAKNFYPMVKVTALDAKGKVLATARTVLPVSDEMTCKACHSTTASTNPAAVAARPQSGWVNDPDPEKDWKKNILLLHDEKMMADPVNKPLFVKTLGQVGYDSRGLYPTAANGKPVLCATCHSSNALQASGAIGVRALTHALHTKHNDVKDPASQLALGSIANRSACYMCHPGSQTQCLRGAMGNAVDLNNNQIMGCQSCHGSMLNVGNVARTGWLSQPNCQACHHDGKRETIGVNANGLPLVWTDSRFATNPNTPAAGFSLYRFSQGHGGLKCESCHGATHAEYPSSHSQDNALSLDLQGHTGTVGECTVCHAAVPNTANGGPHGMHTVGSAWVSSHGDQVERVGRSTCTACHGADYRGSPLSKIKVARTFTIEGTVKTFPAGHNMSCYDCHNGPQASAGSLPGNATRLVSSGAEANSRLFRRLVPGPEGGLAAR